MSWAFLGKCQRRAKNHLFLPLMGPLVWAYSCSYSFTNVQLHPPLGVTSIAVGGIYDSSRRIVPHAHLWESLQREIAQSGKLVLRDAAQADVYLKTHVVEAAIVDGDERRISEKRIMPREEPSTDDLAHPELFEDLKSAQRYTVSRTLRLTVDVEFWDLRSKAKLHAKRYTTTRTSSSWNEKVPPALRFLRAEETFTYLFADVSAEIARQVVVDFYSLGR